MQLWSSPLLPWSSQGLPDTSDHFPIMISNNTAIPCKIFRPRFLDNRADWGLFQAKCAKFNGDFAESNNVNAEAARIKRLIRKSANESIPLSRKPANSHRPIWFNSHIAKLISSRHKAWGKFRHWRNAANLLSYKRACSLVKRECRLAKKLTWTLFLNSQPLSGHAGSLVQSDQPKNCKY